MIHRLLGPVRFRAGIDLYFERHDGQAVTTDDFVAAMEGASGIDLSQFRRWYEQAGTPTVTVETEYAPEEQRFTLHLSQATEPSADGSPKEPFHIPISVGLLQRDGTPIALPGADRDTGTVTLELTTSEASFEFQGIPTAPVASVLGANASGGVVPASSGFSVSVLVSLDDEVSVFDPDVLGSVGVDLHFVVPTAKSVYLHSPLGVVEGGTVEFVGPDELPVRGLGGMSRLEAAKQMEVDLEARTGRLGRDFKALLSLNDTEI